MDILKGEDQIQQDFRQMFVERSHLLDADSFNHYVQLAKQTNQSLELLLIEKAFISSSQYLQLAADYYQMPSTALAIGDIKQEALQYLKAEDALELLTVPFDFKDSTVSIATASPRNAQQLTRIFDDRKLDLKLYVSTEDAIRRALILYDPSIDDVLANLPADHGHGDKTIAADTLGLSIIETAVMNGASDVHIEPFEDAVLIRLRVDGLLLQIARLPVHIYTSLVAYYKVQASLKLDQHRIPQDGRISLKIKNQEVNVRISLVPSMWGEKIVMRVLPKETHLFDLNSIGLLENDLEIVKRNLKRPFGMVLVSGPTGSGKTTSLYAFLQEIGAEKINIVNISTIEDPIEYTIPRVTQIQTQNDIDLTFANGLRALLRQDPDIIMVGEIRDEETADIAVRAALVGRLLLSSIHTNDAVGVIPRLLDMGVEPYLAASTLSLVAAQRLARKLCVYCRQSYNLDEHAAEKLKIHHDFKDSLARLHRLGIVSHASLRDIRFYKAVGCDKCNHTGYNGRVGLYELLEINDKIRPLISEHTDAANLKKTAVDQGMKTMFDDGLAKATLGVIDLDELARVVYE